MYTHQNKLPESKGTLTKTRYIYCRHCGADYDDECFLNELNGEKVTDTISFPCSDCGEPIKVSYEKALIMEVLDNDEETFEYISLTKENIGELYKYVDDDGIEGNTLGVFEDTSTGTLYFLDMSERNTNYGEVIAPVEKYHLKNLKNINKHYIKENQDIQKQFKRHLMKYKKAHNKD